MRASIKRLEGEPIARVFPLHEDRRLDSDPHFSEVTHSDGSGMSRDWWPSLATAKLEASAEFKYRLGLGSKKRVKWIVEEN